MLQLQQHNRGKPFFSRYLELCKSRNSNPLPEMKVRNKDFGTLEFFADRVKVDDWLSIFNALYHDTSLHHVGVKLKKNSINVFENLNTIKKTRKSQGSHPTLLANCIFSQFVDTISFIIGNNSNLSTLMLEGLPLRENFITYICKALSSNSSIKNLSFARSSLGDDGCEIVCSTVKHLSNIDCLNLSQCMLTHIGAESVAKLIKFQKIVRFSEGWEKTLRYRPVNPDTLEGLKRITLNCNALRDDGVRMLVDVLKDDVWIKALELRNCQLTEKGANSIIECLNLNNTLLFVDIEDNQQIPEHLADHIRAQFCFDPDESLTSGSLTDSGKIEQKNTVKQMREKVKFFEQQLETEIFRRKKMELLNENLHNQLVETQKNLSKKDAFCIPDGYVLIESATFEKLLKERDELKKICQTLEETQICSKPKKSKISRAKSQILLPNSSFDPSSKKESKSTSRFDSIYGNASMPYFERHIGDTGDSEMNNEESILKVFMSKRKSNGDHGDA